MLQGSQHCMGCDRRLRFVFQSEQLTNQAYGLATRFYVFEVAAGFGVGNRCPQLQADIDWLAYHRH
jgi:hypothetical protein